MKRLLSLSLILLAMNVGAQELNKKVEDQYKHKEVLLNQCSRDGLVTFPEFKASYDAHYSAYTPDSLTLPAVKKALKGKKVTVVLGTWCGDSKMQVPNFLKVLDQAKVDDKTVDFIAVDGAKHAENGLLDKLKIDRVPTFIFFDKKGNELARITEFPKETLEKDIVKLLATPAKTR